MPKRVPQVDKKIARNLLEQGHSVLEVAKHVNVTPMTIRNWIKNEHWTILNSSTTPEFVAGAKVLEKLGTSIASTPIQLELNIEQEVKTFLERCDKVLTAGSVESQLRTINRFAVAIDEALDTIERDPISYTKELNILSQVLERINRERRYAQGLIQSTIKLEIEKLSTDAVEKMATIDI